MVGSAPLPQGLTEALCFHVVPALERGNRSMLPVQQTPAEGSAMARREAPKTPGSDGWVGCEATGNLSPG
jgi:hypothetical protein